MIDKESLFNSLSVGNLIFAKRATDTENIPNGHKNGPFLVIGRKDNHLICLYATSQDNDYPIIKLRKNNYNLSKDTNVTSTIKLISIDDFIRPIYCLNCLNSKEMNTIAKILYLSGFGNETTLKEPSLEIGDIIEAGSEYFEYLIIGETSDSYITIKVKYINSKMTYKFYYEKKNLLSKRELYRRIEFLSTDELSICLYQFRKYYNLKLTDNINKVIPNLIVSSLKVGNLVIYKKSLYYLYFELSNKKIGFVVNKKQFPSTQKVTIGGIIYYANFSSKRDFDNNEKDVRLISTATEEEKEYIKRLRRRMFN